MTESNVPAASEIRNNAFYILNVSCEANRREIVDAAEERSFLLDPQQCAMAQGILLNPAKRLSAEVDWFPGQSAGELEAIQNHISRGEKLDSRRKNDLRGLNAFLYNFSAFPDFCDGEMLLDAVLFLDGVFSGLSADCVAQEINQCRQKAGIAAAEIGDVERELEKKRFRICQTIESRLDNLEQEEYIRLMTDAAGALAGNSSARGVILDALISRYELKMHDRCSELSDRIQAGIHQCEEAGDEKKIRPILSQIARDLQSWKTVAEPMCIRSRASAVTFRDGSHLGQELRGCVLRMNNQKRLPDMAMELIRIVKPVFAYDRELRELFSKDEADLVKAKKNQVLAKKIESGLERLLHIVKDIKTFKPEQRREKLDELRFLVVLMNRTAKSDIPDQKEREKIREMVCLAARSAGVELNNTALRADLACEMMKFLLNEFSDRADLCEKLRGDLKELEKLIPMILVIKNKPGSPFSSDYRMCPADDFKGEDEALRLLKIGQSRDREKRYEPAFRYFSYSAELGNPQAQLELGLRFRDGRGTARDDEESLKWLRKAADNGAGAAMELLAQAYESGLGVAPDHEEALRWWNRAADAGSANALLFMAKACETGTGVVKDRSRAMRYYESAAERGSAEAMFTLANWYYHGTGRTADPVKALKWYTKAADQSYKDACYPAAQMYAKGEGTPASLQKAEIYYMKGSSAGDSNCTREAAFLYDRGEGVKGNKAEAVRLYNLAMKQGCKDRQVLINLGLLYLHGTGTAQDLDRAGTLFQQAESPEHLHLLDQAILEKLERERKARRRKRNKWLAIIVSVLAVLLAALVGLGIAGGSAYRSGDIRKAAGFYSFTVFGGEKRADAFYRCGVLEMEEGNFQKAASCFRRVKESASAELNYCMGMDTLLDAVKSSNRNNNLRGQLEAGREYLLQAQDIGQAPAFAAIAENLLAGDYTPACEELSRQYKKGMTGIVIEDWKYAIIALGYEKSTEEPESRMDYEKALAVLYEAENGARKLTLGALKSVTDVYTSAIATLPESEQDQTISSVEKLLSGCGGAPKGKILIVRTFHDYDGNKPTSAISWELTNLLPAKYIPASLDEVEYLVVLEYDFRETGRYNNNYTLSLQEFCTIYVYAARPRMELQTEVVSYGVDAPNTYFYHGSGTPQYLSGNRPSIGSDLFSILKKRM